MALDLFVIFLFLFPVIIPGAIHLIMVLIGCLYLNKIDDYSGVSAHPIRNSAHPDRASAHLMQSAL